ncbi:hypothetical protein [Sphingomonas yantingensis]|uniref:Uncharacterized protein n=1 Tax=Sphingomonas yantingensis TaxID=1241761 RepID=A0A7W9EGK4_9SPHN|nr:hypothetical protein [Sphingomonas yantingensis]MBB5697019.1 hypothetical protein [Sphingomonas yantingensis]
MTAPHFHGRYRTISASLMLETLGASLSTIKDQDKATDADLGAVLGKSDDRAAAYRHGDADMGAVSLLRGIAAWDGRFANDALALVGFRLVPIEAGTASDAASLTATCALLAKKAKALEDGVIDDDELEEMWPEIEAASRDIDRLRERRRLRLVSNG